MQHGVIREYIGTLIIELPTATPPLAMATAYAEADVFGPIATIRPNTELPFILLFGPEANTKRIFGTALSSQDLPRLSKCGGNDRRARSQ